MNNHDDIIKALGPFPMGPVIGGKPVDGDGVIEVVDPATEEVIAEVADGTVADAVAAVDVAQAGDGRVERAEAPGSAATCCAARSS